MKNILYILCIALVLGCERELPLDQVDFEPKLVLNSYNTMDSLIVLDLSLSKNALGTPTLGTLSGKAKVLLKKDGILLISDSLPLNQGKIELPFKAQSHSTYELELAYQNYPTIRAADLVPLSSPNILLDTMYKDAMGYSIRLLLHDDPAENNYFIQLETGGKKWSKTDSITSIQPLNFLSSDRIFARNILKYQEGVTFSIFDDKLFNGGNKWIELNVPFKNLELEKFEAEKIKLTVGCMSNTMYDYYVQYLENTHIYGGPLSNVSRNSGNVEQGLGIFTFYTKTSRLYTVE